MTGKLPMGTKELLRGKTLEMVKQRKMTLKQAVAQLKISYRQGLRLYHGYLERGDAALIHRSRGKLSNRGKSAEEREQAVKLYRERYQGFGRIAATRRPGFPLVSFSRVRGKKDTATIPCAS